jgi:hypothetical protein
MKPQGKKRHAKSMNKSDDNSKSDLDNSEPISISKSKASKTTKQKSKSKNKRRKTSDSDDSDEDVSAIDEEMISGMESESKCEDPEPEEKEFTYLNNPSINNKIVFSPSPVGNLQHFNDQKLRKASEQFHMN